jgi:GrpB-like predicted nucleotidyltransferase (UPF0157 family)
MKISGKSFDLHDDHRIPLEKFGKKRTHIHVTQAGSWSEQTQLLFRDYLRTHPKDARRYAKLKFKLADQFQDNRLFYPDAKTSFIWSMLKKASKWSMIQVGNPVTRMHKT